MNLNHITLLALTGLVLTACASQSSEQAIDFAAEAESVRGVEMAFLEFAKQQDAVGAATLFTEDAVLFREDVEPIVGISAVQARLAEEYEDVGTSVIQNSDVEHTEVAPSGDVAFQYGAWTTTGAGESGADEDHGNYLTMYRKMNGVWKIAVDMSLSTKPEPTSP